MTEDRRLAVRARHLENAKLANSKDVVAFAGAMLESHGDASPKFKGSVLLVKANSESACRAILEGDVYVASEVWDLSKAQIIPFKTALTPISA